MLDDPSVEEVKKCAESEQGRKLLDGIRTHLKGHTITDVEFTHNDGGITTILHLSNGQCYAFNDEELRLKALPEQFSGLFRDLACQDKEACDE